MAESTQAQKLARRAFIKTVSAAGPLSAFAAIPGEENAGGSGSITDIRGIRVGHFPDSRRPTGCTVVLFDAGVVAGVDVRGSAPGTRETDLLNPINSVQTVNAILLTGGSAFGLDAATGVMSYLRERGLGVHVGSAVIPIVPAAVLFDLQIGNADIHPDARAGYSACEAASAHVAEGNVGAGAGATVGKLFGNAFAMKSGLGTASIHVGSSGLIVGAMVAANGIGDVLQAGTNKILAGARNENGKGFRNTTAQLLGGNFGIAQLGAHTTIGVVATNASLTKTQATKMAQMAHDGLSRTINPVHTAFDGDTIFAAATGEHSVTVDASMLGAIAAEAMARAVNRAVLSASGIPGYPAHRDLPGFAQ